LLQEDVTALKGVGDKVAEDLYTLRLDTVEDLLFHFPSRYDVYEIKPLRELVHDDKVTIEGKVLYDPVLNFYGKNKSRLTFTVETEGVAVKAVMFNRAFAKRQIHMGDIITLTGKWDLNRLQITVSHYRLGPAQEQHSIQPIYTLSGNLKNAQLKKMIKQALSMYSDEIKEILPKSYLEAYKLPGRKEAVQIMHAPPDRIALKHARRRFTYEELLLFQLKMQFLRKLNREATTGNAQNFDAEKLKQFIGRFPFSLTDAQQKSLNQILKDMKSPYRMNRLLQGDVGSGKTAVAAVCLYASIISGKQGAFMVPTGILAEQHYESLNKLFGEDVTIALLTGAVKGKKREETLAAIENHEADIVIGTHALIENNVSFHDLGFAIIDEQHRFGVEQRRTLKDKGLNPDALFMTATPIPRTLAITAFGDMDVSAIDEMPAGRRQVETLWAKENMLERILNFIESRVIAGEQAYIIAPLIEESDKLDIQNAVDVYHQLQSFYPSSIHVGLMHGRLSATEKEEVMKQFVENEIQILVSTTVVEVGVNVPNATIMVINDAERFGLAQLHQLRGRVGRGEKQSYCILIAEPKGETGKERMRIMTSTTNGFELAEQDLQLRGPGDFFGRKQSGMPEFKVADLVHDYRALEVARKDAEEIIETGKLDADESFSMLKQHLQSQTSLSKKLD